MDNKKLTKEIQDFTQRMILPVLGLAGLLTIAICLRALRDSSL